MAWADLVAALYGVIRGERTARREEHRCIRKLKDAGVIR